jgi:hypothetical protein
MPTLPDANNVNTRWNPGKVSKWAALKSPRLIPRFPNASGKGPNGNVNAAALNMRKGREGFIAHTFTGAGTGAQGFTLITAIRSVTGAICFSPLIQSSIRRGRLKGKAKD